MREKWCGVEKKQRKQINVFKNKEGWRNRKQNGFFHHWKRKQIKKKRKNPTHGSFIPFLSQTSLFERKGKMRSGSLFWDWSFSHFENKKIIIIIKKKMFFFFLSYFLSLSLSLFLGKSLLVHANREPLVWVVRERERYIQRDSLFLF